MALPENVIYANWPSFFRVTIFISDIKGGFRDVGSYPLSVPTLENNHSWAWLLDQLVELGVMDEITARSTFCEVYSGRAISLSNREGRKFMLLMPA